MTCPSDHSGSCFEEVTYNDLSSACIALLLVMCLWRVFPGVDTCIFHSQTMRICMDICDPCPIKVYLMWSGPHWHTVNKYTDDQLWLEVFQNLFPSSADTDLFRNSTIEVRKNNNPPHPHFAIAFYSLKYTFPWILFDLPTHPVMVPAVIICLKGEDIEAQSLSKFPWEIRLVRDGTKI